LNQASERAYPWLVFSVVQSEAHIPLSAADDDGFSGEHSPPNLRKFPQQLGDSRLHSANLSDILSDVK
jgi:hypothetical protein